MLWDLCFAAPPHVDVISQRRAELISPEDRNRVLIKFMDETHVDSFVNKGLLHMNNIQYFREYEDKDPALRGDLNEGLSASWLPENVVLELNGHIIADAVDKIDIREIHNEETNIYCMTILSDKNIIDAGHDGLHLSSKFIKFGNKAVFIGGSDITEFYRRLKNAINNHPSIYTSEDDSIVGRKVTYLNRSDHHSRLNIYNKFHEYSWQFEWRLALKQKNKKGVLELRIGSLSDIVHVVDTELLINEAIKFQQNNS